MRANLMFADPPWKFKVRSDKGLGRSADRHYPTMTIPAIRNLGIPIQEAMEFNSVLLLWTTPPFMKLSLEVMYDWGFDFKTVAFTWIKTDKAGKPSTGTGYYTRQNAEFVLLGTRGCGLQRADKSVSSVIISPRRAHSEKPDEAYSRVVRLFGLQMRIELFARALRPGYLAMGNEVSHRDIIDDLKAFAYVTER